MADSKHSKFQVNSTENLKLVMYIYRRLQGRSQDFSKGGGSHWVKQYRNGVFATEHCRLFAYKKAYKGGVTGTPGPP